MKFFSAILILLLFLALTSLVLADTPQLINFQGKAYDSNGDPLEGTFSIEFTIYDAATEGNTVWFETQPSVEITDGIFHVLLGSVTPIEHFVFGQPARYLGVKIDSDPEMAPRTKIATVPFSYRVATVDGAEGGHIDGRLTLGANNTVSEDNSMVIGQNNNCASENSTISGGESNSISSGSHNSSITAGAENQIINTSSHSAIAGGQLNTIDGLRSFIGAGYNNTIIDTRNAIAGGGNNYIRGEYNFIGGGYQNQIDYSYESVIAGGTENYMGSAAHATICGGLDHTAYGDHSSILGGESNYTDSSYSTVAGGYNNYAVGTASFAAGYQARASHNGSFVWQEYDEGNNFYSSGENQFLVKATGGFGINIDDPATSFHVLGQEESSFMPSSALQSETVIFEDQDAILGLYSKPQGSVGSAITFGEISGGQLEDKWTLLRETASGGKGLRIAFGTHSNPFHNDISMYFDDNGEIGIGTRNPSEKLHVSGSICATGSIGSCSDERFKENIHEINNALDQIEKIKGVEFNWKRDEYPDYDFSDEEQIGFIAQDIKEVLPEVVSVGSDGYHSIDYGKLTPVLVEAVKQLKTENDQKDRQIEELSQRLARIEAMLEAENR
ncbi:MAG: hypothetical protein GF310_10260 [candidate division Zixibacteria bacterium]|nr:hypothetical protein [candidate division Zixibacteria bacterium]